MSVRLAVPVLLVTVLASTSVRSSAQTIGTARRLASGSSGPATGTWQVTTGVAYPPWTIDLTQTGTTLTGTVRQSGGLRGPSDIRDGTIQGSTISFKANSPSGGRIITFTGVIAGDSIAFTRSVLDTVHGVSGAGVFGAGGTMQFTVRRADPATAAAALAAPVSQQAPVAVAPGNGAPATPRIPAALSYKGFSVDISAVASAPDKDAILDAVRGQLDLVDAVKCTAAQRQFFKSLPLVMNAGTGSAQYGSGVVHVPMHSSPPYDPDHPILLHEMMHAYHDLKVQDGFHNAGIQKLYEQARDGGQFPAGSYMLSNVAEYFAMMSSVYLHGSAARDPFTRDAIKTKQPDMYQWLLKEFGPQ